MPTGDVAADLRASTFAATGVLSFTGVVDAETRPVRMYTAYNVATAAASTAGAMMNSTGVVGYIGSGTPSTGGVTAAGVVYTRVIVSVASRPGPRHNLQRFPTRTRGPFQR